MFAGSRLNRQRTVTDLYGVRAIRPAFSTEYQQTSATRCIFVSLKMASLRGDPARWRLVDSSIFSFISACLTSVSQRCAISMRMALDSGSAISRKNRTQIECKRPGSVPIHGLRQPWTGTAQRRGVGEEGRMRTSPTSPILAEICDLDEVLTRDVRDIPMPTP